MSTEVSRGYIETPEGQIHYRERSAATGEGSEDAGAIVLLHQTASSSAMWERVMLRFPEEYRLIALDTPGFGMSDRPPALPGDGLAYYATRVAQAVSALGLDSFSLVGHHTGSMIAAELAATHPGLVDALVLIGCVVIDSDARREELLREIDRWEVDVEGDFVVASVLPRMRRMVKNDDPGQYLLELRAIVEAGPRYWWAYNAVFTYHARERLPLIAAPTLCMIGELEPPDMVESTREAARLIPRAEYKGIDGAGGGIVLEDPELVSSLIVAHVRDSATAT
jgi:pimeloyl-ACP methyl ester carboxylesterase